MGTLDGVRLADLDLADRRRIAHDEVSRVAGRLRGLTDAELDRPAKGDWSIREVIAHLIVVPQFYAGSIERGRSGDVEVRGNRPAAGTGRGEVAAAGIKDRAVEVADAIHGDVVDGFVEAASSLLASLDRPESEVAHRCYHPGGLVPAHRFLVLFLKELGIHEWDIFAALDDSATIGRWGADAAIQAMEEELASGSLRWVTAAANGGGPQPVLRIELTGAM